MATIGFIRLGFATSMKGLQQGVKSFRKSLNGIADAATSVNGVLAGIGVGLAVNEFAEMAKAQADNIAYTSRLADQIGATTKEVSGLQYAFKSALGRDDVEAFGDALSDMQERIGDVSTEGGGALEVMKLLELDPEKLASQDAVTNFKELSDAINGVQSQADKLHPADTLFGGEGQKMLPLIEKGSAGLEEMMRHADELGLSFNDLEAQNIVQAQKAVGELTARFEGLANQAVVQVAPFITSLIEKIQSFGSTGVTVSEVVSTSLEWVGTGLGIVADVLDVVHDAWQFMQAGASKAIATIVSGVAWLGHGIQELLNLIPGIEVEFSDTLFAIADDLHKLAGEQFDDAMSDFMKAPPSEGITAFFDDIRTASAEARKAIEEMPAAMEGASAATMKLGTAIRDLEASLKDQVETFGLDSAAAEIYRLQMQGATSDQLANVQALADQLKQKEKLQKLEEDAKSIFEATRTPLEQFNKKLDSLFELNDAGLIDTDTLSRAVEQARGELGQPMELPLTGPAELGSSEARSAILRNQFGMSNDPWTEQLKTGRDQLVAQRETNRLMGILIQRQTTATSSGDTFEF